MIPNGTYTVNEPGAATISDARRMLVNGKPVTAQVHDGSATVFVGLEIAYQGPLPAHVASMADLCVFAARIAVAHVGPAPEAGTETVNLAELSRGELAQVGASWRAAQRASDYARDCAHDSSAQDSADAAWDAFYGLCNDYGVCASCWSPLTACTCA